MSLLSLPSFADTNSEWLGQIQSANLLVESGDLDEAETRYGRALHEAETAGDKLRLAVVLQSQGKLHYRRGQTLAAEKAYLRALGLLDHRSANEAGIAARISIALAGLYTQTGQDARGEAVVRRLLQEDRSLGDADQASLQGTLGLILTHRRQFDQAEQALRRSVALSTGSSDADAQEVGAIALANIGDIQLHQGRMSEAVASYRKALATLERLPHAAPAALALTLAQYAAAVGRQGDLKPAGDLYRKAINIAEARLGANHAVLAALLEEYSEWLRVSGNKSEAKVVASNAQRIRKNSQRENLTGHTVDVHSLSRS